jgi:hypothetical protein
MWGNCVAFLGEAGCRSLIETLYWGDFSAMVIPQHGGDKRPVWQVYFAYNLS